MPHPSSSTTYSIGIPLPETIQQILAQTASGLNNAEWFDPAFYHISLRTLGTLDDATVIDVANALNTISYTPFFLTLLGPRPFIQHRQSATLGIALAPSVDIEKIKNLIQNLLSPLKFARQKKSFEPYVPIGNISTGDPFKLEMYIREKAAWSYSPFLVKSLALFSIHTTKKTIFSQILKEFPLYNIP